MSIVAKLTVTPLLYACGALLLIALGLGVALKVATSNAAAAESATTAAHAATTAVRTERDAWKREAQTLKAANTAWGDVVKTLKVELAAAQGEARRVSAEGQRAVAQARDAARDAERTLSIMATQFQAQSRKPACAHALANLEAACPAFSGY